ncbi:hypothetical protein TNCV_4196811 [Trichonephila clavipes]|nr:hypothetical protein TNCV_4196811 [Trichonephila clavipes]
MRARNYCAHHNTRDHWTLRCMNRCPDLVVCLKRDLQCLRPEASLIHQKRSSEKHTECLFSTSREENPQESISGIIRKVSELTGVSKRTVFRLKKEKKTLSALSSPGKKTNRYRRAA